MPASWIGTLESAAALRGGRTKAKPIPPTTIPGASVQKSESKSSRRNSRNDTDRNAIPAVSRIPGPTFPIRRPTTGPMTMIIAIIGSIERPVSVAEKPMIDCMKSAP